MEGFTEEELAIFYGAKEESDKIYQEAEEDAVILGGELSMNQIKEDRSVYIMTKRNLS